MLKLFFRHKFHAAWLLAGLVLLLGMALFFANFVLRPNGRSALYTSDLIIYPALFRDLTVNHGAFADWTFSAKCSVFPDMLLYFASNSLIPNFQWAFLATGVAQYALFLAGWLWVARRMAGARSSALPLTLLSGGAFAIYAALAPQHFPDRYDRFPFVTDFHFGAVAAGVFTLGLAMRLCAAPQGPCPTRAWRRAQPVTLASLFILVAAASLSDLFFVMQIVMPLLAALGLLAMRRRRVARRCLATGGALLLASAAGAWLAGRLFGLETAKTMSAHSPAMIRRSALAVMAMLREEWLSQPVYVALWMLCYAACLAAAWRLARGRLGPRRQNALIFAVFIIALPLINLAGIILNGFHGIMRYFIPSALLPCMFGWPLILSALAPGLARRAGRLWAPHALAALLLALLFAAPEGISSSRLAALKQWGDYYPDDVRQLDAWAGMYGFTNGLGDYWQAKRITMFSRAGVHISQITKTLQPHLWLSSRADYRRDYQFILTRNLDEKLITSRLGNPARAPRAPLGALIYPPATLARLLDGMDRGPRRD